MANKPTYEELEQRVKELENETFEWKQAEKVLKENELKLRVSEQELNSILHHSPDIIYRLNPAGEITYINDIAKEYGYSREDLIGKNILEFVHPDDREKAVHRIDERRTGDRSTKSYEIRLLRKDLDHVPFENKSRGFGDFLIDAEGTYSSGKPGTNTFVGTQGIARDILERNQAERALRESEEKYRSMMGAMKDPAYICSPDFRVEYMNPAMVKRTGRDAIGEPCYRVINELDEKCPWCVHNKVQQGESLKTEITIPKDSRSYNISNSPIFHQDGSISKMTIYRDITEHKQAEEALRESEEKYRSMMEAMDDEAYICSSDFRIEYMNPAMINRIGRDATGETCHGVVSGFNKKCPWCVHEKVMKGEYVKYELVSPIDAKTYHISNSPIFHTDKSVSKLTVSRDFTEMKKLEAQLQQALKMEAMGTLAGGIAHDFNNLLMAIQSRTSIMLMKKDSSHPDIKHLRGIEDDIESAADLTRQLLGFARGGKYEVKPTDLNELIKKQNRMFGRTKKEITIRGKYEENLWFVEVDRGQIEQVLLNLYVNAWQAMPGSGDLYLETENVTLDKTDVKPFSTEPGKYVEISVTDTGVGMDKATREKIFEPFFTTKGVGRGTGLGLASAYGIIKNHGGFINVYSEKGHGTTFNIYLPASEKEAIEEKKAVVDTLSGSETVLFVDDENMIIETAEELFEQLGYKVLRARSGKEAIEIYVKNKEQIDIVLLDMIMPDMSGSDTYDKMKKIDPDIKVLLSSGYSINGQATEIMDRGCNGFIQKPFKMKELSQKLREILDEK